MRPPRLPHVIFTSATQKRYKSNVHHAQESEGDEEESESEKQRFYSSVDSSKQVKAVRKRTLTEPSEEDDEEEEEVTITQRNV